MTKSATDVDKERLKEIVEISEKAFKGKQTTLFIGMAFHEEIARITDNKLISVVRLY